MRQEQNIQLLIKACKQGNRSGQKKLYQLFFGYGMSVALRYSGNRPDAEEIMNESFYKVFSKIESFDEDKEFKKWFRRILINTAIDYQRKYKKLKIYATDDPIESGISINDGYDNLAYEDLLKKIQLLPPGYRTVFNMYAIDGLKHHEIAEQLGVSVGTSKSNYSKAKKLLQSYILGTNNLNTSEHG